jgi:hypothetical protein
MRFLYAATVVGMDVWELYNVEEMLVSSNGVVYAVFRVVGTGVWRVMRGWDFSV